MREDFPADAITRAAHNIVDEQAPPAEIKTAKLTISEAYGLSSFNKEVCLANYTDHSLTDGQLHAVADTLGAAASFTGGKIFDRLTAFSFMPPYKNLFPNDEPAMFNRSSKGAVIMFNSRYASTDHPAPHRIAQYFRARPPSQLHYFAAHELGHAMDIVTLQEMRFHGITLDDQISAEELAGITAFTHLGELPASERPPTGYAATTPREDFAESFAITLLGGDTSSIPKRHKLILHTIHSALGGSVIGPHKVKIKKLEVPTRQ